MVLTRLVKFPQGVSATKVEDNICIKGPKGEITRAFYHPDIKIEVASDHVRITSEKSTRIQKKIIGSYLSHLKNMAKGVTEGYEYKMKVLYSHFPMSVKLQGETFVIENFIGEKKPRKAIIPKGINVQIKGQDITITGSNLEDAGNAASKIEGLTKIRERDRRKFQDGIYITEKPQ